MNPLLRLAPVLLVGLAASFASQRAHAAPATSAWQPFERQMFDTVGMASGLPHSTATALVQDRSGILWIGTMSGLARYDGYRSQTFELQNARDAGLPDTYVRKLLPLPGGDLLIGTNAGGLVRFNQTTLRFRPYPKDTGSLRSDKIYDFAADHERGVWIATDNGLDYLNLADDRVAPVDTGSEAAPRNFSVFQDRAGNLWLGNEKGLFVRRPGHADFVRPDAGGGGLAQVLRDQVWAICEDAAGRLWVGSVQRGAVYRDLDGRWHAVPGLGDVDGPSHQPTVRDFLEVAPGRMWIATDGEGIQIYPVGATHTTGLRHDVSMPSSLPGDSVRALLLDASGNVWAATDLGAARTNARPLPAFTLLPAADARHSLSDPNVRSILVDTRQRIWLGLAAGHIDVVDLAAGAIRHLRLGGLQLRRDVQSLAEAPDGAIWVGTQGVARIDPDTFAVHEELLPSLSGSPVLSMLRVGGSMVMGTYDGVYRHDADTGALVHYRRNGNLPGNLAGNSVHQVARVGHALWYGTSNGISIADDPLQTAGFRNLVARNGDDTAVPVNRISSIASDQHGRVWVGTLGGLALLAGGGCPPCRFHTLRTADGLVSDKIGAVLPDNLGQTWVSTSNGLAVVDDATLRVRNLGARDGQFVTSYTDAAARAADGTLLFGGLGGLTVIRPQLLVQRPLPLPPLRITSMRIDGHLLPFGKLPGSGGRLALGPGERSISFDFALLDFQPLHETLYSYRMVGFDHNWTELGPGASPSASYTNLPHGRYTLELRAETRGLHAANVEYRVTISVAPRWYETAWARLLAVVALLAAFAVLVHLRTLYLRRRAKQLQAQINVHTRELRAANRRLDLLASTDELTGIYNRRRFLARAEEIRRLGAPASMALLDLDHFKRVNDDYGHLTGDAVLRHVAGVICQQLRAGDLVGRYGGEEIVMCLPGAAADRAMVMAERIRTALRASRIRHEGVTIAITVSIGVAELRSGESMNSWLSRADAALYASKHAGRDRCTLAG